MGIVFFYVAAKVAGRSYGELLRKYLSSAPQGSDRVPDREEIENMVERLGRRREMINEFIKENLGDISGSAADVRSRVMEAVESGRYASSYSSLEDRLRREPLDFGVLGREAVPKRKNSGERVRIGFLLCSLFLAIAGMVLIFTGVYRMGV